MQMKPVYWIVEPLREQLPCVAREVMLSLDPQPYGCESSKNWSAQITWQHNQFVLSQGQMQISTSAFGRQFPWNLWENHYMLQRNVYRFNFSYHNTHWMIRVKLLEVGYVLQNPKLNDLFFYWSRIYATNPSSLYDESHFRWLLFNF